MKTRNKILGLGTVAALAVIPAHAALQVSNGDFSLNPTQTNNVTGWFDTVTVNTGSWWETTWAGPTVSPNGTPVMGLSYNNNTLNWAYQSIGINAGGLSAIGITYDVGSFTDAGAQRDLGLTFSVYQVDGTYAGGADNTDISGATGATLLDSVTVFSGLLNAGQMLTGQTVALNISGSTGSELYLRIENAVGATTGANGPWTAVDNISVTSVPEPTTLALAGLGGMALLGLRRRIKG